MHFNRRQTAAVLAGLRLVQLQLTPDEEILAKLTEAGGFFSALQAIRDWVYADAADLQEPLTADEIDELCERINTEPDVLDTLFQYIEPETLARIFCDLQHYKRHYPQDRDGFGVCARFNQKIAAFVEGPCYSEDDRERFDGVLKNDQRMAPLYDAMRKLKDSI